MPRPHASCLGISLACLVLRNTACASVSPWLTWLMGKPRKTQSDGLGVSQDKPHNLSICCLALPQPVSLLPRSRFGLKKCLDYITGKSIQFAAERPISNAKFIHIVGQRNTAVPVNTGFSFR